MQIYCTTESYSHAVAVTEVSIYSRQTQNDNIMGAVLVNWKVCLLGQCTRITQQQQTSGSWHIRKLSVGDEACGEAPSGVQGKSDRWRFGVEAPRELNTSAYWTVSFA